jgi:hypothetical protein
MRPQFTADGRLAPEPAWCKMHYFEDDYHWTRDLVALWLSERSRDSFRLIDYDGPWPVGRACAEASIAEGKTDPREITEWRG